MSFIKKYPLAVRTQHAGVCAALALLLTVGNTPIFAATASSVATPNITGAWSGTASYNVNDVVTYGGSMYIDIAATAPVTTTTPATAGPNLFDKSAVVSDSIISADTGNLRGFGGFQTSGFINVGGASAFITNITINIYSPNGVAFYDANRNYVGSTTLNGNGLFPAGVPISVPGGSQYVRFWWANGSMGTTPNAAIVNAGTILQSSYTSFGTGGTGSTSTTTPSAAPTDTTHWAVYTPAPATQPTVASTSPSGPWVGKKMFVLADSIIWANPAAANQIATAIGATPSSQGATAPGIDAFPGRAFDGFQNGQGPTGIYLPLSASVIADVDLMLIALGTNQDSNAGIGTVGDAPSLNGSMSAQMRAMLETIMSWKPGMRIVVVGPYQSNRYNTPAGTDGLTASWAQNLPMANAASIATLKNVNAGMKAVCSLYGIPYIDMFDESGVNFSTSALWLVDGLHPNSVGYSTFYVPYIAAQLGRYVQ